MSCFDITTAETVQTAVTPSSGDGKAGGRGVLSKHRQKLKILLPNDGNHKRKADKALPQKLSELLEEWPFFLTN